MKQYNDKLIGLFFVCLLGGSLAYGKPVSELKKDEALVFFNTSAWLNEQSKQWHIPIHGWVFEPENSIFRKDLISDALTLSYGLSTSVKNQALFDNRVNLLLADNERNKSIVIRFADRTYALPASTANGHFQAELVVDEKLIAAANFKRKIIFQAVLNENDSRVFSGRVNLVSPNGISIISDIDDTIKISAVTDRKQLLNHTFFLDFKAVAGMAELYQQLLKNDGALHFVSSSPWQLYPALIDFINEAGFPTADYGLKSFRFKDSSLMNLFASSLETKPPQIVKIIANYPNRKFVLIGDSGEKDPEIYAQIQQQFPQQIIQILIRNVSKEKPDNNRFETTFKSTDPKLWQLFNHVDEIKLDFNSKTH